MKVSILQVDRCKPILRLDAFDHAPVCQHLEREPVQGPVQDSQIQDWSKIAAFLGYNEVRAVKPLPHLGWRDRLDFILFQEDIICLREAQRNGLGDDTAQGGAALTDAGGLPRQRADGGLFPGAVVADGASGRGRVCWIATV